MARLSCAQHSNSDDRLDPITQGALGASLAQSVGDRGKLRTAAVLGALAGLAPDLDVLIRSPNDPLLFLEYHRQFSHALAFIPFGALLCALALHVFVRRRLRFAETYASCLLGYATHGLLDACTSYGTMLLWPFSEARIAWNVVSVVDPVLTLVLLALLVLVVWRRSPVIARVFPGGSVATLDGPAGVPWLDPTSQQARDLERFRHFSDGYLALDPRDPHHVTDVRYAMVPNELEGLWAVALDPRAGVDDHVRFVTTRGDADAKLRRLLDLLFDD